MAADASSWSKDKGRMIAAREKSTLVVAVGNIVTSREVVAFGIADSESWQGEIEFLYFRNTSYG